MTHTSLRYGLTALLCLALTSGALAQVTEGVVVSVEGGELVLDVGRRNGLTPDTALRLFRRLVVQHPITGESLQDRFPIGEIAPAEIGERLTIVRRFKGLSRAPQPGDFVVFGEPAPVEAAPAPAPRPTAGDARRPADEVALEGLLVQTLGQSPEARAQHYAAWLKAFPDSRYATVVGQEADALRRLAEAPEAVVTPEPSAPMPPVALHDRPLRQRVGQPLALAVGFADHARVQRVRLYVYRDANDRWTELPMQRDGDAYWRAAVPAALLAAPGTLHYLIEAIVDETSHAVVGTAKAPAEVTLEPLPALDGEPGTSQLSVMARYVDFNTAGDATDAFFQAETSFAYGLDFAALTRVRVGVGVIDGEGGPTDTIDLDPSATRAFSVNYAFAEGELALGDYVGVAGRGYVGTHHQTEDGTSASVGGAEARLRVGPVDGTRLTGGFSVFDVLGAQGFVYLDVASVPRVPIRAGVVVTNLPVDADLGVQLEGQVGWRVNDLLTLNLLTGWNARTINHYGFTGGGGLTLDW